MVALAGNTLRTPDEFSARNAAVLFKALAGPLRVQLVAITSAAPVEEQSFQELAEHFTMPHPR